jgi:hypothetical protein
MRYGSENLIMSSLRSSLLSTIAVVSLAGCSPGEEAQETLPKRSPSPMADFQKSKAARQYTRLDVTDVTIEGMIAKVSGITDLPEGSELSVSFDVEGRSPKDTYIGVDAKVAVQSGKFNAELKIPKRPEFAKGRYVVEVLFTPKAQTESILSLVGHEGERLSGKRTKDSQFGFKMMETARRVSKHLKVASYRMITPSSYSSGQPEHALAGFLSAWKHRRWSEMVRFTQQSWRRTEDTPAKTLENWFEGKDLLGSEIMNKSGSRVASDITVKVYCAIGSAVQTHVITARIIREDGDGNPRSDGKWGVNPLSVLREE